MRKAITLLGKAAELYFLARCADSRALAENAFGGGCSHIWQKSSENVDTEKTRLFSQEVSPVLITEYKPTTNTKDFEGKAAKTIRSVTGDMI